MDHGTVQAGGAASVTVDVTTSGIAVARGVLVEVIGHLTAGDGGVLLGSFTIDQLDALSSITLTIPLNTLGLGGSYELVVVVNRSFDVLETTDANNTSAPVQLTVIGDTPPTLVSSAYRFEADPALVLQFSESINGFDASDLQLVSLSTGQTIPFKELSVELSPDGLTATIRKVGTTRIARRRLPIGCCRWRLHGCDGDVQPRLLQ